MPPVTPNGNLAGDDRVGGFARSQSRRRILTFARRAWAPLAGAFAIGIVGTIVLLLLPIPLSQFLAGAFFACVLWATGTSVVLASGVAPLFMGDSAEMFSAEELRRLERSGWRLANHVTLKHTDIDHLLVGPGGVLAVETK